MDSGCGSGENAFFFASRGYKVTGIDLLDEPITIVKRKAMERGQLVPPPCFDPRCRMMIQIVPIDRRFNWRNMSDWVPLPDGFLMQFPSYVVLAPPFIFHPETHKINFDEPNNYVFSKTEFGPAILVFTDRDLAKQFVILRTWLVQF